jgi:serine/threonine protein kinase
MGIVYLSHDPYVNCNVALKVALADSLTDPDSGVQYRKVFFNEAHTAGMLTHPNIISIFEAGVDDDTCYIVMEYIEGGDSLKSHTKPEHLLPIEKVVEIIFKCANTLDYAHRQRDGSSRH